MAVGAIKPLEGSGENHAPPARVQPEPVEREVRSATPTQTEQAPKPVAAPLASTAAALSHLSTRVALDTKTLRAYIQTVTDDPAEQVVHSYPAGSSPKDPSRFVIVA